jgi:glutamyl-tRNA synthetase
MVSPLLGWSPTEELGELFSLENAAKEFSFDRVTKAGGKFDWDKLNWVNGQYIHRMPVDELTTLLMPYWEQAGFEVQNVDRAWLEQLVAVVGPSLAKLSEVGDMTRYLFVPDVGFTEDAQAHLKQPGVSAALEGVLVGLTGTPMTEESAKLLIDQVVKSQGVKKGLVMKSLRAGLTGSLQGPDLMQSWLLLSQKGWDKDRLEQAIASV